MKMPQVGKLDLSLLPSQLKKSRESSVTEEGQMSKKG
jgi:hypothetical protein